MVIKSNLMVRETGAVQMTERETMPNGGGYRQILDASVDGVCVVRREDGLLLYANRTVREVWGVDPDGEKPCYCYEFLAGETAPCGDCRRECLDGRGEGAVRLLQADAGRQYQVRLCAVDWEGVPACAFYLSDVTWEMEAARRSRSRYLEEESRRRLQERDILIVAVLNMTRRTLVACDFSVVRQEDLKLYPGQPVDEALEYLLREVPSEADRKQLREMFSPERALERMQRGVTNGALEHRRLDRRGDLIWVRNEYSLVEEPDSGDVICYAYIRSINEARQYQQMLDTIVGLNYDFALLIDCRTGRASGFQSENRLPEVELHKARDPELARADMLRRICVDEDVEDLIRRSNLEAVTAALERSPTYSITFTVRDGGRLRRKEMTFAYLDETRRKICCFRHDITDVCNLEKSRGEELAAALARAREASQAKDEFLSRMSHDIRTPLNGILGLAGLALEETREAHTREYLQQLRASGNFLLSLVNDILDMSKISGQKMELHPSPYGVEEWQSTMQAVIGEQCRSKGLHFQMEREGDGVQAVLVDRLRFDQIVLNLLSNAVKFTPAGGSVTLRMHAKALEGGRCRLWIAVEDTGVGMSRAFQKKVFEPFSQERAGDAAAGTGLGLPIVKSLTELMGGKVRLRSSPGAGTCVTVELTLPRLEDWQKPERRTAEHAPLEGRRVLLAEDHPINAAIACKILERRGMLVDHVEDGRQAVERFAASGPGYYDAVLMDIRMPVLDGLAAAEAIRRLERPDAAAVPILALTANAFADDVEKSRDAGMNGHLAKPVEPEKLYEMLAAVLCL